MKNFCLRPFFLSLTVLLSIPAASFAQPANDNCAAATPITVDASCAPAAFTSIGATAEATDVAANPSCGIYQGADVWFTFTTPASGNFRIETTSTSTGTTQWALYSGTCGNFTQVLCSSGARNFSDPALGGQTFYLRVYRFNSTAGNDFNLCIWEIDPPANDLCANATPLTVGQECNLEAFSSQLATAEATDVAANPSCGFYQGGDVWFTFTSPASGNFRIENNSTSSGSSQWVLYSGSCGNFTQVLCTSGARNFSDPALAGQDYYIRVFRTNSDQGTDFNICVWETNPPANDLCANATPLTVGQECSLEAFSSQLATAEPTTVAANPSCGFYQGGDVWFTFTSPASGNFRIENNSTSSGSSQWALYSGSCGNFTQVLCSSGARNFSDPALGGQDYYLRIFRTNSDQGTDFNVCVWETTPPANNNCADATTLSLGFECAPETFSSQLATAEPTSIAPNPTCGFYQGGDIWFKFVVPLSGNFRIETTNISGGSVSWALYAGTCGDFTQVFCTSSNTTFAEPDLANETLYLRAHRINSDQGNDFSICIFEILDPPTNDLCADAIDLSVGVSCIPIAYSSQVSTSEPTSVAPNPTCGFYQGGDVWFTFTVPLSGNFRIELDNLSSGSANFAMYSGTCGDFTQLACASTNTNFSRPDLAGLTLYLRLHRINSIQGNDFSLCVWETEPPLNDFCGSATQLNLTDSCTEVSASHVYTTTEGTDVAPNPTCGFYQGGDVWYRFTAPDQGAFDVQNLSQSGGTNATTVYLGSCGSFQQLGCMSGNATLSFDADSLAGQDIYLRFFRVNSNQGSDFSFCVRNTATAPNDNCADATPLSVEADCTPALFGNYNSTPEADAAPGCGNFTGNDVWFTFEVPASGQMIIIRDDLGSTPMAMAVYSGSCGSFEELYCSSSEGQLLISAPEFADQTLYLRVYSDGSSTGDAFSLCLVEGDCSGTVGGTAFFDECGTCVGGTTGLEPCVADCNGVPGGTAFTDDCDTCVGGDTGLQPCQPCNVDGGTIATTDPTLNLCIGDGQPNIINVSVTGNVGVGRFGLVIPGSLDVVASNATGIFDMENYPAGTYQIRHVSVNNIADLQGITNGSQLSGCFDLANTINVTTIALNGGALTANGPTTLCGGNLSFSVTGSVGPNQRFALLNFNATEVLALNNTGTFNFDNYSPGSYRVVHIAYSNAVNLATLTPPTVPECMDASNQVAVTLQSCASLSSSPNPTTGPSQVTFSIAEAGHATLEVYDLSGRLVQSLYNAHADPQQPYRLHFDGSALPNGVYLYRLSTTTEVLVDKFMLAR